MMARSGNKTRSTALIFFCLVSAFAAPALAAEERITFGYSSISADMAGVWMAKETGAFERYGLNADLVYISSGAVVIQALVAGSLHAGLGASNAVAAAVLKGAPILAVAADTSRPSMALWVQPEIVRPEQLEGKTVAITRYGSTTDFIGRLMLKKIGLEGKANLRPFGGGVEADAGFRSRQADGRVATQPPGPQARKLLDGADLQIAFSADFLAVSSEFQKKSPRSVERIVMAYTDGVAALRTRKAKALEVLSKYLRQRGGSPEWQYEYVLKYFDRVPRIEPGAVEMVLAMLGHSGPAPRIADNSIIDKLEREGFIDKLYNTK
ncbi:MAG TPA: ABC transporter substrate-binding protein [Candidatus Binatia bacterium]|jgi:ABC-type nitrate/sulfonate/bicarbonate transport system substrate-binding protein